MCETRYARVKALPTDPFDMVRDLISNDFIRSYISWTQFASYPEPLDTLSWRYFQKNFITCLKLQRPPSLVCITLLPTLGNPNVLPYPFYCFHGFLDHSELIINASSKSLQHSGVLHIVPYRASNGAILMVD